MLVENTKLIVKRSKKFQTKTVVIIPLISSLNVIDYKVKIKKELKLIRFSNFIIKYYLLRCNT